MRKKGFSRQLSEAGFTLIGAMLMLSVFGMLTAWYGKKMIWDLRVNQGELIGKDLARLNAATLDFARRYQPEILRSFRQGTPGIQINVPNRGTTATTTTPAAR
jgi:hypothetical protein